MATATYLYEFEGDTTQSLSNFTYRYRKELVPKRIRPAYARVLFEKGDITDYLEWVETRSAAIAANTQILSEYGIDGAGGRVGGGFWFSVVPIAGASLITEITVGETTYSIDTVPVYAGDLELTLNIYKEGTLVKSISIYDEKIFRTGIQERSTDWQYELVGNVDKVRRLDVATSVAEIRQIEAEDET